MRVQVERGYPYWAYRSRREFKAQKRKDLAALIKALDAFRNGCAYTPAALEIDDVDRILEGWKVEMSAKKWGR